MRLHAPRSASALLLTSLALACLPTSAPASGLYRLTDLGVTMRRDAHLFTHINDRGQVIGSTFSEHPTYHRAFLYNSRTGAVEDWGRDLFDGQESTPVAINDRGQALVRLGDPSRQSYDPSYAVVEQGRVTSTYQPEPGVRYMTIGNDGQPRGYDMGKAPGRDTMPVALVEGDRRLPMPAFPANARNLLITQMSDTGLLVGGYDNNDPDRRRSVPFLIKDGELIDLSGPGFSGQAYAVNSHGDVALHEARDLDPVVNENRLTLHDRDGERTILDDAGIHRLPQSINDSGQIVGSMMDSATEYHSTGFLFDGEALHDLNDLLDPDNPDWFITRGATITESGQILATALGPDGLNHAVLLTPTDQLAPIPPISLPEVSTPVPEPTTLLVLGVGLGLVLAHRRGLARR